MRIFIVICMLATALGAPQGYSYQQQHSSLPIGLPQFTSNSLSSSSSSSSASASSHSSSSIGHNFLQEALQSPKIMQSILGGGHSQSFGQQSFAPKPQQSLIPSSFGIHPQQQQHHQQQQQQFFQQGGYQQNYQQPGSTVTKDIYVHVAPEEPEERFVQPQLPIAPPRKHYRIVFIKAPAPKYGGSALRVQPAQSEEKTIIYVLTKKPDPVEFDSAVQEVSPKQPSKPEVYFIKYKTQEEAQHAQRTIQAQYDKLGGTTQVSDEGVAPVTSVIGALDQTQGSINSGVGIGVGGSGGNSGSSEINTSYGVPTISSGSSVVNGGSSNNYLPPIRL